MCNKCGGKGYHEDWYHYANKSRPMLRQCCDIKAYSRRVQLMNQSPEDAFKSLGSKEPFIGREMNVTHRGIEFKPNHAEQGEPCRVIPLRPR